MSGRSKTAGADAVAQTSLLKAAYKEQQEEVKNLQSLRMSLDHVDDDLETQLHDAQDLCEKAYKQYRDKWKLLGVDGRLSLNKLQEDPYLQLRMNALVLKQRICERLRH